MSVTERLRSTAGNLNTEVPCLEGRGWLENDPEHSDLENCTVFLEKMLL